jgi:hypothetical protein
MRLQAVGSGEEALHKPKGLIRTLSIGILGLWLCMHFHVFRALGDLKLPSLTLSTPEISQLKAKAEAAPQAPAPEKEAPAQPAGPLVQAKGKPVALWNGADGAWYFVNQAGQLEACSAEEASQRIDLPVLEGVAAKQEPLGSQRVLALDLNPGLLSQLLPLSQEIAPEVQGIWFEGSDVNLRTAEGAEARLGSEDFKSKEARLAAVLADLAARKQRPALVDLRFKDTAVVKLASR